MGRNAFGTDAKIHGGNSTFINSFDLCFTVKPTQHHIFFKRTKFSQCRKRLFAIATHVIKLMKFHSNYSLLLL